ncbi:porin, partial [Coleofasciculus sp. LEGE 07081]|nr:porin [Coleofasciculus sp. LEGE 07081]
PQSVNSNPGVPINYNPATGQYSYAPQGQVPLPQSVNSNPGVPINYNPATGQYSYAPQGQVPLPQPVNSNPGQPNNYNTILGQSPSFPQTPPALPNAPNPNLAPPPGLGQVQPNQDSSLLRSTALREPSLQVQGTYVVQGDSSVGRARLAGLYPLTPKLLFGATLDLTSDDSSLADSPNQGLNINELYLATAPFDDLPNLRFVVGQLDLTSYFDRNSFAKDGVTHFFNAAFQTNPALSATGIASHPGFLVNWTLTDNIEAKAAAFSSSSSIGDFALDGFAGEIGLRYGNAIIRGTYSTSRDAGSDTGFQEIFSIARGDGEVGLEPGDREEAYGLNAEYFIPEWNMGVFGRYGRYINRELDEAGDTYSFGVTFLDVFTQNDRLGLAYGQNLSNNQGREKPDVLELFYDFRFLPNLRLGFSLQQRDGFSETDVGVRVKTEFDVLPRE